MGKMEHQGFGNFFGFRKVAPVPANLDLEKMKAMEKRKTATQEVVEFALREVAQKYGANDTNVEGYKFYHNLEHTKNVLASAKKLAERAIENGNIAGAEDVLVEISAVFHDIEQGLGGGANEEESVRIAQEEMSKTKVFSLEDIEKVKKMVLSTTVSFEGGVMKQSATDDYLEKLVADADLSSLGQPSEIYWKSAQALLKETKHTDAPTLEDQLAWALGQIAFLSNHEFYTNEAKELFPHKEENIEFAKAQIKRIGAEINQAN